MDEPPSFAQRLIDWQRVHGRHDLPWQNTRDPYRVWLSEIMLQQTQVSVVIPFFERFTQSLPDVRALALAPIDRVLALWSGLGYYRRAHHLHAAARRIVDDHGGAFPRDVDAIAALPGIGRSTAAAIAAFAFGTRGAILDGNVKRVFARHAGVGGYPGDPKVENALWRIAEQRLPGFGIEMYTQGLMDLGATLCARAKPACLLCPVATDCVARRDDRTAELPAPRPRKPVPARAVRVLLFERGNDILLEKRSPSGVWGGLWSLPELPLDADARAFAVARFGAAIGTDIDLPPIEHGFTHFTLTMHPRRIAVFAERALSEPGDAMWLPRDDALNQALPAPIRKLIRSCMPRDA